MLKRAREVDAKTIIGFLEHGVVGRDGLVEDVSRRRKILVRRVEGGRTAVYYLLISGLGPGSGTTARSSGTLALTIASGRKFASESVFHDRKSATVWRRVNVKSLARGIDLRGLVRLYHEALTG